MILFLTSCGKDFEKIIVNSDDGKNSLTILKTNTEIYLINGNYESEKKPYDEYIQNNGGIEYYRGLINWSTNMTKIYTDYGIYDTTHTNSRIKLIKLTTSEFENLKKDSLNHKYFYY